MGLGADHPQVAGEEVGPSCRKDEDSFWSSGHCRWSRDVRQSFRPRAGYWSFSLAICWFDCSSTTHRTNELDVPCFCEPVDLPEACGPD